MFHSSGLEYTKGRRVKVEKNGVIHPQEPRKSHGKCGLTVDHEIEYAYYWFFGHAPEIGIYYDATLKRILPNVQEVIFRPGLEGTGLTEDGQLDASLHMARLQGRNNAFPVHAIIGLPPENPTPEQWVEYISKLLEPATLDAFEKHYAPRNNGKPLRIKIEQWTASRVLAPLREEIAQNRRINHVTAAEDFEKDYRAAEKMLKKIVDDIKAYRAKPAMPVLRKEG